MDKVKVQKAKKTSKPTKGERSFIARAPIRRLMKQEGASLVSEKSVTLLVEKLTELGIKATKKALSIVKEDSRKRVTKEDIAKAI